MYHRNYFYFASRNRVENKIGTHMQHCAMDTWHFFLIRQGFRENSIKRLIEFTDELYAQRELSFLISFEYFLDIRLGTRADKYAACHLPRIRDLTSSQGELASGFLREASRRRTRSLFVASVTLI